MLKCKECIFLDKEIDLVHGELCSHCKLLALLYDYYKKDGVNLYNLDSTISMVSSSNYCVILHQFKRYKNNV